MLLKGPCVKAGRGGAIENFMLCVMKRQRRLSGRAAGSHPGWSSAPLCANGTAWSVRDTLNWAVNDDHRPPASSSSSSAAAAAVAVKARQSPIRRYDRDCLRPSGRDDSHIATSAVPAIVLHRTEGPVDSWIRADCGRWNCAEKTYDNAFSLLCNDIFIRACSLFKCYNFMIAYEIFCHIFQLCINTRISWTSGSDVLWRPLSYFLYLLYHVITP